MEFYKEVLEAHVQMRLNWVKQAEEELSNHNPIGEAAVLWEVGQLIEDTVPGEPKVSWTDSHEIRCYCDPMTPGKYEAVLDDMDECFKENGYTMDLEHRQPAYITGQQFCYVRDDAERFESVYVGFESSQCVSKPTGKMIPERKSECNLIKM